VVADGAAQYYFIAGFGVAAGDTDAFGNDSNAGGIDKKFIGRARLTTLVSR